MPDIYGCFCDMLKLIRFLNPLQELSLFMFESFLVDPKKMSTDRTCNSSFWTKDEDKILENTLAIYSDDKDLFTKMEEALPGKSRDDIINHYNILIEDVEAIDSGRVPLPNYLELQSDSNQNSRADVEWRRGASWTELEHRSFLRGLDKYGRGDWKSISRNCVITRTPTQVASHAQKYFKRLQAVPKEKRRASILNITSADAEAAGTSQAVPSTKNEIMLPRESINAEQTIAVAEGESSGHDAVFVNGMDSLNPDRNGEFIFSIDDIIMEEEDANETGFLVDTGRSLLPSEQPCAAASTGAYGHPITRIGSDLEALLTEPREEDNDINSIFVVRKAPTSHEVLLNAGHSGISSYAAASFGAENAPESNVAAYSGMSSYADASSDAVNAPDNMVAAHSGMTNFAVTSRFASNAPQATVAAHASQLPPFALSSNFDVGDAPM
ncbi:hypothetical protein FXO38_00432 [Capsicum annuum]|nr:hypothetical protein FXO38_00432 [Capsicum annuum]KAF3685563.1 hypothetical protein FXO37_00494 [Capsicum annuum]